ncbi:MazG nucleotide pyrophosphohydrolase domain-containing protein [Piscibacillus salipiscarius]|uniref:MazG nucleotide pyrophosphohydrolase domain-containing protein n=1 Tax=Piscibacillus salipiscarius TaxID=299480 RepID=A0ABW5QA80_9BACI|nr:MazG nucleotide pyrophosphohydrolase domain-containing protein [Piscibacillus salipiscarius]
MFSDEEHESYLESITVKDLQKYIKAKDFKPDLKHTYFHKLIEEVGELSEVLRKNKRIEQSDSIKGTIEEELYDVLYYVIGLANVYDIDLEECFHLKEEINKEKYL